MMSLTCSRRSGSECSVSLDCVSVETSAGLSLRPSPAALTSPLTSSHQDAERQDSMHQRSEQPCWTAIQTMQCIRFNQLDLALIEPKDRPW